MADTFRAFGYICPECGKAVMACRSSFALAASKVDVECSCGKSALQVENDGELSENIGAELSKYLRQSDYVGFMNGENVCILLANTKKENAFVVVERLRTYGYTTSIVEVLS